MQKAPIKGLFVLWRRGWPLRASCPLAAPAHPCAMGFFESTNLIYHNAKSPNKGALCIMAERVGFEPTDSCPSPVFKTGAFDQLSHLSELFLSKSAFTAYEVYLLQAPLAVLYSAPPVPRPFGAISLRSMFRFVPDKSVDQLSHLSELFLSKSAFTAYEVYLLQAPLPVLYSAPPVPRPFGAISLRSMFRFVPDKSVDQLSHLSEFVYIFQSVKSVDPEQAPQPLKMLVIANTLVLQLLLAYH